MKKKIIMIIMKIINENEKKMVNNKYEMKMKWKYERKKKR